MNQYNKEVALKRKQKNEMLREKNKKVGDLYLKENRTKKGIVVLDSGLQYEIINKGDGNIPTEEDVVEYHQKAILIDGTVIENTYESNIPQILPVRFLFNGLKEAIKIMPIGSKWRLYIPPELGFGENGRGPIEPNSTIIFEIELISIKGAPIILEP